MSDDHPALGPFAKMIGQNFCDILIGEPVKAIADNPFIAQIPRQGEQLGKRVLCSVKARVETGDLG